MKTESLWRCKNCGMIMRSVSKPKNVRTFDQRSFSSCDLKGHDWEKAEMEFIKINSDTKEK